MAKKDMQQERLVPEVKLVATWNGFEKLAADHILVVFAKGYEPPKIPGARLRDGARARRTHGGGKAAADGAVTATEDGRLIAWVEWDAAASAFERQTALRKALTPLLQESPRELAVVVHAGADDAARCAAATIHAAAVNGCYRLGKAGKADGQNARLARVHVVGAGKGFDPGRALALAEGNLLARAFTLRPPNDLTPARYRAEIARMAKAHGWKHREWDFKALRKMGAGAFCAVAQGSPGGDAAIVRLSYTPPKKPGMGKVPTVALVGKGICMDTGGHGLKTAKHMYGMHEDMNGSAVVLGLLKAASDLRLPIAIDAWLAIAQNHIGPDAYQPGDVVTALDGTTIEIVHTDAEGRMALADTLTLAAREKPALMVDFATLTGVMVYALGSRMCGVFASTDSLGMDALAAGTDSGERVCLFPMPADYDGALESKVADVKQCLIEGEADSIYAARLLSRFTKDTPWIHMDLSAYRNDGGLGAVAADVTGFGVGWGLALLEKMKAPR